MVGGLVDGGVGTHSDLRSELGEPVHRVTHGRGVVGNGEVEQRDVRDEPSVGVHDGHGVDFGAVLGQFGELAADLGDAVLAQGGDEPGGHGAAHGALGAGQQSAQAGGLCRGHAVQEVRALACAEVTQCVDGLVGFHFAQHLCGIGRARLTEKVLQLAGLHLLQRIGSVSGLKPGQQLLALRAAKVLQYVGEVRGPELVQRGARAAKADLGRPFSGVFGERGHRLPVQYPLGGGPSLPASRPQPAEQRGQRDIYAHQHDAFGQRCEIQIGGAGDLDTVHVHQLVVEHVTGKQHLTGATLVLTQVHPCCPQTTRPAATCSTASTCRKARRRPTRMTSPVTGG